MNLSIRRKAFYNYYFKRFDKQHNLELIVLRPDKKEVENFVNKEFKTKKQVFILSHAGEFKKNIIKLKLNGNIRVTEKDFYIHEVYHYVKFKY